MCCISGFKKFWVCFCVWCEGAFQLQWFLCSGPAFPTPLAEETSSASFSSLQVTKGWATKTQLLGKICHSINRVDPDDSARDRFKPNKTDYKIQMYFPENGDLKNHSVQFSHSVVSNSLRPHELQHARPPCPSPTPGVHSNSCASSRWCHPAISFSVIAFSSCPHYLINFSWVMLWCDLKSSNNKQV